MEKKKLIIVLATLGKLSISVFLIMYFWKAEDFITIKYIDIAIILLAIVYILLQLLTRKLSSAPHWWDWVYYIGLLCIMIASIFISQETFNVFHMLTRIGTVFLILPLFADIYQLFLKKNLK
jgi:uncharacterized membrane protein HdeD (DUF308 family)